MTKWAELLNETSQLYGLACYKNSEMTHYETHATILSVTSHKLKHKPFIVSCHV